MTRATARKYLCFYMKTSNWDIAWYPGKGWLTGVYVMSNEGELKDITPAVLWRRRHA